LCRLEKAADLHKNVLSHFASDRQKAS